MSNATLERPEQELATPKIQPDNSHRFFDPQTPEQPEQVLGVNTKAILRLGRAVTALGVLPPKANLGLYALPDAIRLVPLVEEMQSGAEITPEDVRPYRKPIKRLSMEISFADKLAAGAIAVGVPIRLTLNRKIEREFPSRAAEAIDKAREAVASIEHEVDYISSFENPREQFVTELNDLAQTVSSAITEQRDWRVRNNVPAETEPEVPKGIMGFFTKTVRKIRDFFGFFKHKPKVSTEVTAYDAGAGIEKTFNTLVANPQATEKRLPMLSKLVLDKLPDALPFTKDRLALIAPEILNFLFSTSSEDKEADKLIRSVNRNPHELRFVTRFKKHYGRYSLDGIQRASRTLMPAIRDVLPTSGDKVREIYAQAQDLLERKQSNEVHKPIIEQPEAKKKGIRNRLKNLFSKSRKQKQSS
jgi:hypothetical protein